jgi:hypothetical protein
MKGQVKANKIIKLTLRAPQHAAIITGVKSHYIILNSQAYFKL